MLQTKLVSLKPFLAAKSHSVNLQGIERQQWMTEHAGNGWTL